MPLGNYDHIARNYADLYKRKYGQETLCPVSVILRIWEDCRAMDDQDTQVLTEMREHDGRKP